MHIPKYIIEKMHKANKLISEGNALITEIYRYFEDKGVSEENLEKINQLDTALGLHRRVD